MKRATCQWTIVCDTQEEYDEEKQAAIENELCTIASEDLTNLTLYVDVDVSY